MSGPGRVTESRSPEGRRRRRHRPRVSSTLAVLLVILLAACEPAPDSAPVPDSAPDSAPRACVAASTEPARAVEPGALEGWPLLEALRWPTPRGAWQGAGRSWKDKVGASARDYPGPAALIAPPRHPGAQLTLLTTKLLTAGPVCDWRPKEGQDWLGVAVPLRVGGAACADTQACWADLEELYEAGASLVLAEGLGDLPPDAELGPSLAWKTRQRVHDLSTLHQLGVVLPASPDGLLHRADRAHLVVLEGAAADLFETGELRLLDSVVRATGRRPVIRYPFASSVAGRMCGEDHDLVLMGQHLALGGALLVRGPEPLPVRLEAARTWLRQHPELVQRSMSSLQLYFDPRRTGGDAPSALGRALDAAHVPWEVAARSPEGLAGQTLMQERLENAPLLALSDPGAWQELVEVLPQGAVERVVIDQGDRRLETLRAAVEAAGGQVVAVDRDGGVERYDSRYALAQIETDLPATVHIVRTAAPQRGLVTHHLFNRQFDEGGGALPVAASRLVAAARSGLGDGATCRADWHLPAEQRSRELPCTVVGDGRLAVELPSFSTWAVLTTRLVPEDRASRFGQEPIRIESLAVPWSGTTVSLDVPFLASDLHTTLSLPEYLRVGNGEGLALESMEHTADVSPDGRSARLVSEGSGLRLERELRAYEDHVDVDLTLTNIGDEFVLDARALVCLATKNASPFPESGHAGTFFVDGEQAIALGELPLDSGDPLYREDPISSLGPRVPPLTVMRSIDDHFSLGCAFQNSDIIGGNGARTGVCLHARPCFGNIAPGAAVTLRGKVYISPDGVLRLAQRWREQLGAPIKASADGSPTWLSEVCGSSGQEPPR